jgi:hypothetical protein
VNDNDELNDGAVLSAVRESISGVPMPTAPRLEAITARGRARRRRQVTGLSVAAAGACAALVIGLAGGGGSAGPAPQHGASPIHLTGFSVAGGPGGQTTLTLYPNQVINPNAVRQALAEHGIPALVTAGEFCTTANHPAGVGQVVSIGPLRPSPGEHPSGPRLVINGSAIPRGAELSIGYRQGPGNREISFTLIQAGASRTCTSIPDNGSGGHAQAVSRS